MVIEQERIPAFQIRVEEVISGVPVYRKNGAFLEKEAFGLGQQGVAFGWVTGLGGIAENVLKLCVMPAGTIVSAIFHPHVEEGQRVHIVAYPTPGGKIVILVEHRSDVGGPLHLLDLDGGPKVFLPHSLQGFGRHLGGLFVGGEELNVWKAFAPWVTGFGEQLACKLGIKGNDIGGRVFPERRNKTGGRFLAAFENIVDQGFLVERKRECKAYFGIGEGLVGYVSPNEVGSEIKFAAYVLGVVFP